MSGSVCSCPSRKCHLSFPKMWAHCNNLKAFSSVVRSPKRSDCQELCRPVMTVYATGGRWVIAAPQRWTAVSLIQSSGEEPLLPPTVHPHTNANGQSRPYKLTHRFTQQLQPALFEIFRSIKIPLILNYQKTTWKDISIRISSWAS